MSIKSEIIFFDREKQELREEKVFGESFLNWLYQDFSGKLLSPLLCRWPLAKVYGFYQSSSLSQKDIKPFIEKFEINVNEFEEIDYHHFNSFFARKFKRGQRIFVESDQAVASFVEGRFCGYPHISTEIEFPVKGKNLNISSLLKNAKYIHKFEKGALLIGRLAPVDYHRFHFPFDCEVIDQWHIPGLLHSVGPYALKYRPDVFLINDRYVTILKNNVGKLFAMIEVGAFCVGRIEQTYSKKEAYLKGEEKGTFYFGGSTVILLGEEGAFTIDKDILEHSKKGIETFVKLGDKVGIFG